MGMLSCFWEGMPLPILDKEAPREGGFLSSKLTAGIGVARESVQSRVRRGTGEATC